MEQHRGRGLPRLVACDVATACWVDSGLEGPVLWAQGAGAEAAVNADVVTSGLFLRAAVTGQALSGLRQHRCAVPQSWTSDVHRGSSRAAVKVSARLLSPGGSRGDTSSVGVSHLSLSL